MPLSPDKRLTSLFDNSVLNRLEHTRINSNRIFTNKSHGEHLGGREGSSNEFSDYREYVPGDDIRFIDWNIFSRHHKPFLKLFHEEEELHVLLLIDTSASMAFEGKLQMAKQLAAAFGVMALWGTERVSVFPLNAESGNPQRLQSLSGRGAMNKLFTFIEQMQPGGAAAPEVAIENALKWHKGRGVAVVASDFLSMGELKRAFNLLFSRGLEIFAIQVLSPMEIDPDVTGDLRLIDCETDHQLDVSSAADLITIYHEHRLAYQEELAQLCAQRRGRFMSVSSGDDFGWVLFDQLLRKGWIR